MKKYLKIGVVFCVIATFLISACQKDKSLGNTNVTAVDNLFFPEHGAYVQLAQGTVVFEWEQARAEDNGLVMYEVLFDIEDGDFSDPIYSLPSDGNGVQRRLTLSHGELNRVAALAGIASQQTGTIKWTVVSSKGINVQPVAISHALTVERPLGFSDVPSQLFLMGSASESGDDASQALAFTQIDDSKFEIHTLLGDGAYYFATARNADAGTFALDDAGVLQEEITSNHQGDRVVRIRLDFSDASASVTEIVDVALWFAPNDNFMFDLPYAGNGTWEALDQPVEFKQESWGRDERYKFRFTVRNASGDETEEWYGSVNADNSRPTADSSPAYWYMVPVTSDRWNNSFKFHTDVDNSQADVQVIFNADVDEYTHIVTVN